MPNNATPEVNMKGLKSARAGETRIEFTGQDRNEVARAAENWRIYRYGYDPHIGEIFMRKDRVWCCIGNRRLSCD